MKSARHLAAKAARPLFLVLGCVLVVIGVVGVVLPVMPGTIFLILAAACFARSSPRFETWLLTHPRLGPPIVGWRKTGAIPVRAKIIAISAMTLSFGLTVISGAPPIALWTAGLAIGASALYVGTRPSG